MVEWLARLLHIREVPGFSRLSILGFFPGLTPTIKIKMKIKIFWEVVGLERGPLSLVSTIEELLERKSSFSVYKIENAAVEIRCADHGTPSISKKIDDGRSFGTVRSRTQATELFVCCLNHSFGRYNDLDFPMDRPSIILLPLPGIPLLWTHSDAHSGWSTRSTLFSGSVVGWDIATGQEVAVSSPNEVTELFSIYLILPNALWPCIDLVSNRNEYQKMFLR
jgi:hypothetical protein